MTTRRKSRVLPKAIRDRLIKVFAVAGENEIPPMIWEICDAIDEGLAKQLKGALSGLILARIRGIAARETLKSDEGGHISADKAAQRLKISRAEVMSMYRKSEIIGWREGRQVRFPVWQFSKSGLLPGLQTILEALRPADWNSDWARMLFFLGSLHSLGGKRPLDLLREKRISEILPVASRWED